MLLKKSTRLLIATFCAVILVVFGIYRLKNSKSPTAPPPQTAPLPTATETPIAAETPAAVETAPVQPPQAPVEQSAPIVEVPGDQSPILAFRQWAETTAAVGIDQADQHRGMELAKARADSMKLLIQKDPASALRQALPADLRAALSPQIAAAIEQPVKKTGMFTLRMMCNHSPDKGHDNCESAPVLLDDILSWNAHFGEQQWRANIGQTVKFDGIAVQEELAVQSITPASEP